MHLFHYHLVTSRLRDVEARYLGRLGFRLVARHGRIGETHRSFESGTSWEELDQVGFKLRLSEIERGALNVVVQPGHWSVPRVDHIGLALDEDEFEEVLQRAALAKLRVQEHAGRRTFVATNAGYRLEIHPPRDWIEDLIAEEDELRLTQLHLRADDPHEKAMRSRRCSASTPPTARSRSNGTVVRFVPGGPEGRPELDGELFQ